MGSSWFPWVQVARGIGSPNVEDHLLLTPRVKKVCAEKGGEEEKGKRGTR